MKKMKKAVGIVLILVLGLGIFFSGCAGNGGNPADTTQKSDTQSGTGNGTTAATSQEAPKLEPVKLTEYLMMGTQQQGQDAVFAEANKYIKEKINAEVNFIALEWGNYVQKMSTIMSAGEEFDITWIASWYGDYAGSAVKGSLLPIDDLITQYAPKTKAFIPQKIWDATKVNGKIYGIPCYQIMAKQNSVWVRKDLAEKYNYDISTLKKWSDLEPFLKAVKDGEKDITPLAANNSIMWWFGREAQPGPLEPMNKKLNDFAYVTYDDPTKVIEQTPETALGYINAQSDWLKKGYIRKDFLSIKDLGPEVKAGKFAAGFQMMKPGVEAEFKDTNGFDIVSKPLGDILLNTGSCTASMLSVGATSKNPERAMMLLELYNSDKYLFNLIVNGIENVNYIKTSENRISRVEKNTYQSNLDWAFGNTFLGYITPGKPDNLNELTQQMNDSAVEDIMTDFTFNIENVKNEVAGLQALWKEMGDPLMAGVLSGDPATLLKQYRDKQLKAGLEKVLQETQKQVDAYWAAHKQ